MDEKTPGKARGISVYDFFPADGRMQFLGFVKASNPSYVITDRSRQMIYCVHEHSAGEGAGVSAFKVSRKKDGKVRFLEYGHVDIDGDAPCHLAFAERNLAVSCYGSGQLLLLPLADDGKIERVGQNIDFPSEGGNECHIHCSVYQPMHQRLLVTDLGGDLVRVLTKDAAGNFSCRPELDLKFERTKGPRHIALHPAGELAFVNGEKLGTVSLVDVSKEQLSILSVANALPERVLDEAWGAAIRLSNNGKIIYCSDRTFSVVNALKYDQRAATVKFKHTTPSGGESPRDLILSLDGEWLLTANTATSSVGVFRIDPRGELTHYHTFQKIPTPTVFAWL